MRAKRFSNTTTTKIIVKEKEKQVKARMFHSRMTLSLCFRFTETGPENLEIDNPELTAPLTNNAEYGEYESFVGDGGEYY